jgi:hypothetical protein
MPLFNNSRFVGSLWCISEVSHKIDKVKQRRIEKIKEITINE